MTSNLLYGTIPRELSSVTSLQTLILDDNMFSARLPECLESLRVLALSRNHFYGEVPGFSSLKNLQELDLEDNAFGPRVPQIYPQIV